MTDVVAIDVNLFLRHTVRRFLCAMQEVRGGAGAGSGRSPARKRQEIPEDRRIDAHRVRCTVYVRPD